MILEDRVYLKTSELNGGEQITFKDEGAWVTSLKFKYDDGSPRQDFVIKVEIFELEKDMRLNKTNREILKTAYGKDTAAWVGKTATISLEKVMVGGKKMDTIVLTTP